MSRATDPPEEILEEQEVGLEGDFTPHMNICPFPPEETVMLPVPSMGDDFKLLHVLTKRVADTLQIPLQEVTDTHHKLLDILHTPSSRIALPIN